MERIQGFQPCNAGSIPAGIATHHKGLVTMKRPFTYILVNKVPVAVEDIFMWGDWMDDAKLENRVVKQDQINDLLVSTVFLGVDHGWGDGPPLLFETLVFWIYEKPVTKEFMGKLYTSDREAIISTITRYSTWQQAEEGHERAVKETRKQFLKEIGGTQ